MSSSFTYVVKFDNQGENIEIPISDGLSWFPESVYDDAVKAFADVLVANAPSYFTYLGVFKTTTTVNQTTTTL
jgi:hypothetical protein